MKKLFIILFIGLLFTSCEKERKGYSELVMSVPEKHYTKTHLEPDIPNRLFDVIWDANDQVKIYDNEGGEGIYTNKNVYEDNNHEVAHFGGDGIDITQTVTAFYPVSIASSSNRFVLPYEQTYRLKNDGYIFDYPMWAQETNNNHIWFRNLTGILILRLRGPQGTIVRNVFVKEPSDPLGIGIRGTYDVTAQGSTHTNEPVIVPVSPAYDIMLNCTSNPVTLSSNESSLFYLSVPEGIHSRLLVGLEYKLPTSTDWATTYQMIFAQSYNEQNFKFERSKWVPIDVDFVGLDESLIYSLKNINLNPSVEADTVINTDIPLTTAFGEYTFAIDLTPDDISSLDHNNYLRKTIYSEMDNTSSNYDGIIIRLAKQNNTGNVKVEVVIGNSTSIFSTTAFNSGERHQIVVTISNYSSNYGTVTLYFMRNRNVTSVNARFRKTLWISTTDPTPQVGGDQHIPGRYFDGQLHSFSIYNRVWTNQEINRFITQ